MHKITAENQLLRLLGSKLALLSMTAILLDVYPSSVRSETELPDQEAIIELTDNERKNNSGTNPFSSEDFEELASDSVLPKNSAIVCRVLMDIVMDPERRYSLPITLLTTLDVYDANGEVAIPSNSIVSANIKKQEQGDLINIERIVYRGLTVPIKVDGRLIPAQIRPERYGEYIEPPQSKTSSLFQTFAESSLFPTLLGVALADGYNDSKSTSSSIPPILIGVLGAEAGINLLTSLFDHGPKRVPPLVEIQKDTLIVFTLTDPLELPNSLAPETVLIEEQ